MDFVTRLKQYIEFTGLAVSQFADTAEIPRPTLSQILNGRNKKISNELIAKLHSGFPKLNILWMLFGDGTMEVSPTASQPQTSDYSLFSHSGRPEPGYSSDSVAEDFEDHAPYGVSGAGGSSFGVSLPNDDQSLRDTYYGSALDAISGRKSENERNSAVRGSVSREANLSSSLSISPDSGKRVQSIMVFYTDNSFEIFTPSQSK